jgi:hypothetical protein
MIASGVCWEGVRLHYRKQRFTRRSKLTNVPSKPTNIVHIRRLTDKSIDEIKSSYSLVPMNVMIYLSAT